MFMQVSVNFDHSLAYGDYHSDLLLMDAMYW